jgi:phage/plasmid primase-like uncharacterized protein
MIISQRAPLTFDTVHRAAADRWHEILASLGIDPAALRNRHGPCPDCGGTDRFRFDDKGVGRFYCNGGGEPVSGDGFKLLQHVFGWSARDALARVAAACGMDGASPVPIATPPRPAKPPEPSRTQIYARELWLQARTDDAVVGTHPYAIAKGIGWAAGAGRVIVPKGKIVGDCSDCLVVPIRSMDWRVIAVQAINTVGAKQTFGPMGDGCLILGNTLDRSIPWVIVEGWADAVSLVFHVYKGNAVAAAAFGIERMERVAHAIAEHYQPDEIVILEDAV